MEITDTTKSAVATWIAEGKSLADVQRMLREEHSLSMTYMDVRFLVDDLDISVVEPEEEIEETDAAEAADAELVDEAPRGGVVVDVDALMLPGSLVSGTVTFSDGKSLKWQLSAAGQLGLIPGDDPEYRPLPEDVQEFQAQLEEVLRQKGI